MGGSHETENTARDAGPHHTRADYAHAHAAGPDNARCENSATDNSRTRGTAARPGGNARAEAGVKRRALRRVAYFTPGFFS